MILLPFFAALAVRQCSAFIQAPGGKSFSLRGLPRHHDRHVVSVRHGPLRLEMAKKGSSSGSKRKKKKEAGQGTKRAQPGGTSLADTSPDDSVVSAGVLDDKFESAGEPTMSGGFGGSQAGQGEILADGVIGTDATREAKIEETLRKMGVQGIRDSDNKTNKSATMSEEQPSIFQVVPEETQVLIERIFIAGFAACLLFLVACGGAIATEAYFVSTAGKLPPDLDNFIVNTLQPLLTPSLVATFAFSSAWGLLKMGQMNQEDVVYREDR